MDDVWHLVLRIAKIAQKPPDAVERQVDQLWMQIEESRQNGVDPRFGFGSSCGVRGATPQQADDAEQRVTQLTAMHHEVNHAVLEQIFRALKAIR